MMVVGALTEASAAAGPGDEAQVGAAQVGAPPDASATPPEYATVPDFVRVSAWVPCKTERARLWQARLRCEARLLYVNVAHFLMLRAR